MTTGSKYHHTAKIIFGKMTPLTVASDGSHQWLYIESEGVRDLIGEIMKWNHALDGTHHGKACSYHLTIYAEKNDGFGGSSSREWDFEVPRDKEGRLLGDTPAQAHRKAKATAKDTLASRYGLTQA